MTSERACDRARPLLSAYLENDLPTADRALVDAELAACADCRAELDKLRATLGQLGALRQGAPPRFLDSVQKRIHDRSHGRFFKRRWMLFGRIPFEWVSLAMILAMLAYFILAQQGSPGSVSP